MKHRSFSILWGTLLLALCAQACTPATPTATPTTSAPIESTVASPSPEMPVETVPPTAAHIEPDEEMIKNFTYDLPQSIETVAMTDGQFLSEPGVVYASVLPQMAFGDLNADGLTDAAVLLVETAGGDGAYTSLVVLLNSPDGLVQMENSAFIDNGPVIHSLSIQDGRIILDATVYHAIPENEPTLHIVDVFELDVCGLTRLTRETLGENGRDYSFFITSPENLSTIEGGTLILQGTLSSVPSADYSLAYYAYDPSGSPVAAGVFEPSPNADDSGFTFETLLDISLAQPGADLCVVLSETSNGDRLAQDAIVLTLRK